MDVAHFAGVLMLFDAFLCVVLVGVRSAVAAPALVVVDAGVGRRSRRARSG